MYPPTGLFRAIIVLHSSAAAAAAAAAVSRLSIGKCTNHPRLPVVADPHSKEKTKED